MIPINNLIDRLTKLPSEIYERQKEVVKAKENLELVKANYEVAFAFNLLESDRRNATEKKAQATINTSNEKNEMVKAQVEYERQSGHLKSLENQFVSMRKVASLEAELNKSNVSGN